MIPLLPIIGPWLVSRLLAAKPGRTEPHARFLVGVIQIAVIGAVLLVVALVLFNKDDDADQIRQTNRTASAVTDAATDAIQTLEGRTATEDAVDQATQEALNNIAAAPDAEAVRDAVLAAVCNTPEHRSDPACL